MVRFGFLGNVRFSVYNLKLFFSGPYAIDDHGGVTFSPGVRALLLFLNLTGAAFVLFYTISVLRPSDVFTNKYKFLGFLRAVLQHVTISTVSAWNVCHSRRAGEIFSRVANLGNHLRFTDRQLKWMTVVNGIQAVYVHLSGLLTLHYVYMHWGTGVIGLNKLTSAFFEFSAFSAELTFINIIIILNQFGKILQTEMESVTPEQRVFSIVLLRHIIGSEKKITKREVPSRVEKLRRMRDLYREVYDIKEEAHEIFSYPLLVTTATTFGNVVFFVFVNTMQLKYGSSLTMVTLLVSCYYPIMLILKLGVIVTVCHAFKEMTKSLRRKTAELFKKADSNRERDVITGMVQEMEYMDPEITCHKFAVIDYEMASSMMGIITTYTIILLQTKFEQDGTDPVKNLLFFTS